RQSCTAGPHGPLLEGTCGLVTSCRQAAARVVTTCLDACRARIKHRAGGPNADEPEASATGASTEPSLTLPARPLDLVLSASPWPIAEGLNRVSLPPGGLGGTSQRSGAGPRLLLPVAQRLEDIVDRLQDDMVGAAGAGRGPHLGEAAGRQGVAQP